MRIASSQNRTVYNLFLTLCESLFKEEERRRVQAGFFWERLGFPLWRFFILISPVALSVRLPKAPIF